jgi:hypothetical protein
MAVNSEASNHTVPHHSDGPAAAGHSDPLSVPPKFTSADKLMTVALIFMFFGLFVWLIGDVEREFYAYLTFLALLTFIFVGILQATGIIRTASFALGGSVAVFVGLWWATVDAYDKYHARILGDLNREISHLTRALENNVRESESIMRYSERRVGGTVQLIDGTDLSKSLLRFTLRPEREDVTGPFAGSGEGENFRASIRLPLRKNTTGEENHVFTELNVSYPGYYPGCVLLEKGAADSGCAALDSNGSFNLTLKPTGVSDTIADWRMDNAR